jgi:hypothetical protein
MVINFFVFTQPRDKPLSQLIGRRTAKGRDQPAIAKALKTAYSLSQAHIQVRPTTASGPQLPLMAKNELIAIAKLQAEIAPQLPTFIFERRPQTTALRTTNLRAYSAG